MNTLSQFAAQPFITALKDFFDALKVPINPLQDLPILPVDIFGENYKPDNKTHQLIDEVYVVGTVDDTAFTNPQIKSEADLKTADYDFILILGIKLKIIEGKNPSRGQLAELTRLANKAFNTNEKGNPVTVVFKYGSQLALANTERQNYIQNWRAGEKIGKVTLLRDIDFTKPHAGHTRILSELVIPKAGKNTVESYETLYKYWQGVLSVSILNKAFYGELQNWYFWAIKEVTFPNAPIRLDFSSDIEYDEALKEHKAKNVIRLLTRILFIWFIKEKGLIPEEIFDEKEMENKILKEFVPQKPEGLFVTGKQSSKYYRAVLQNLFFATLNQTRGNRAFRGDGQHQNVTQLMRYKTYFKNADHFIHLMEKTVPFMNGGLFECLDKPHPSLKGTQGGDRIIYVDGFSDRADNDLIVPDFLFFDADEEVDLSADFGSDKRKKEKTRGLIAILKSYKFTITENTPIDEDVALDPELLGKVFENLLASYNPETKTTARKQTGSFYTPREIVNYMVDESLIAYLKNCMTQELPEFSIKEITEVVNPENPDLDNLDLQLHQLISYSDAQPFTDERQRKQIIKALDACNILDPACGSGAYPMGILQKMVHILHKIDPNNTEWRDRQLERVNNAIAELEKIDDADTRNSSIKELEAQKKDIEESFANNELDYGRKLYLIENCIFGVDIQPIATQISKLRFFISLVVDQKVDASKDNFGIRPLPNLETKFVAANTLIGIKKLQAGDFMGSLFDKKEVKKLEKDLKKVRKDLFSAKTPNRKRALREADKTLREQMSTLLVDDYGNATANLLANWDPYDQNTSSPFFDKEWMFDITDGFDIVIGNPPYVEISNNSEKIFYQTNFKEVLSKHYDLYLFFFKVGIDLLVKEGILTYITPHTFTIYTQFENLRKYIKKKTEIIEITERIENVFESAVVDSSVTILRKSQGKVINSVFSKYAINYNILELLEKNSLNQIEYDFESFNYQTIKNLEILKKYSGNTENLGFITDSTQGITVYAKVQGPKKNYFNSTKISGFSKPFMKGRDFHKYSEFWINNYIEYGNWLWCQREKIFFTQPKIFLRQTSADLIGTYIEDEFYCIDSVHSIIKKNDNYDLKYILSIINSKFGNFLYKLLITESGKVFAQVKLTFLRKLPIKQLSPESQLPFINLVDKILEGKKAGIDTLAWEAEIDLRVYKLYELTYVEVLVVEPGFGISEREYEGVVL